MQGFFFHTQDESREDGSEATYVPTPATVGPWSQAAQHGGPPSALLVRAAERCLRLSTGRTDLAARRYAADFVGPVPVAALRTRLTIVRAARSAALVQAELAADGRLCLAARIWFVARTPSPASPPSRPNSREAFAEPEAAAPLGEWTFPYARHLEWRMAGGSPFEPGPAAAWVRPRISLLDTAEPLTGLQRAVLVGDSASGVSSQLPWDSWSFANVDLDLHLARDVEGEWLLIDAETVVGPDGSAVARSTLSDVAGVLGGSLQTLVVRPR